MVSLHKSRTRATKARVFINLYNVVTIQRLGERTFVTFVNGGTETLATAPEDVIQPNQGSG